jgi:hypothetical protein
MHRVSELRPRNTLIAQPCSERMTRRSNRKRKVLKEIHQTCYGHHTDSSLRSHGLSIPLQSKAKLLNELQALLCARTGVEMDSMNEDIGPSVQSGSDSILYGDILADMGQCIIPCGPTVRSVQKASLRLC